jgi:hypothetical protein
MDWHVRVSVTARGVLQREGAAETAPSSYSAPSMGDGSEGEVLWGLGRGDASELQGVEPRGRDGLCWFLPAPMTSGALKSSIVLAINTDDADWHMRSQSDS